MNILIVDDNETDRKVLRNILEREGIQTIEAEDGVEALTVLEREKVDAVISDVIMPNMDGYQFCYELRQSQNHRRLPVVIYTSQFSNENIGVVAREFGANFYLKKPASPAQILESIQKAREAQPGQILQSPLKLPDNYKDKKTYSEWLIRKLEEQNDELERSEYRYRQLVELSPDGVVVVSEGQILFVNEAGARILGASSIRELEGRTVMDFVHPDFKDIIVRRTTDLLKGELERNPPIEHTMLRLHGEFVDVETMSASFRYFDKPAILVLIRDITDRKKTQVKLRESERNLNTAQKVAHIGSWALDLPDLNNVDKNPLSWSDQVFRIFGYEPGEIEVSNESFFRCVPKDDWPAIQKAVAAALKEGTPYSIEHRVVWPNGEVRFVHEQAEVMRDDKTGKPIKFVGTVQDITERKQAHDALHESERMLSTLVSNLPGIVYRCKNDPDWTMEYVSEGALSLTGYPMADFLSRRITFGQIICPDDRQKVWDEVQKCVQAKHPFKLVYRIATAAGTERWVWEQGQGVFDTNGELIALEGFVTDLTVQKKTEEELRLSETNYRMLMEQASDAVLIADERGNYIEANNRAVELFGYTREELLQKKIGDLSISVEDNPLVRITGLEIGQISVNERKCRRKDGSIRITEASGKKLSDGRLQVVFRDVTERKQAEEVLRTQLDFVRRLADMLPAIVYVYDLIERKPVYVNRAAGAILGYSPQELQKMGFGFIEKVMHPEDAARYQSRVEKFMSAKDGAIVENDFRLRHSNGEWSSFQCQDTVFNRDADGRPRFILGIARDITVHAGRVK